MDSGAANLQSGFVLAALIVAILLVDRFGGPENLAQRFFQIALAVTLAFTVVGATTAFIRPPEYQESNSSSSSSSSESDEQQEFFQDLGDRHAASTAIHFVIGVAAIVLGIALLRRWPVSALAIAFAGLLLVLFGGVGGSTGNDDNGLSSFFAAYASALATLAGASQAADIVRFAMLALGSLALLAFGLNRWDMAPPASSPASDAVTPDNPAI